MIEKTVIKYLSEKLKPVPVLMEYPEQMDSIPYVVMEKTGSGEYNCIKSATIALQSVDESLQKAAELNETVKAAMDELAELRGIGAVSLNSDYNFTDTTTKQYRYQAIYNITYCE